jgi:gluconate 2-dehydrogenase gamma chain
MTKHDEGRRAFLIQTAVGMGAVAGAGLVPDAHAAAEEKHKEAGAPATSHAGSTTHGAFFNDADAATVSAFAERLMPGAPGKPGAREANVVNYIDMALAGAYEDQQEFYRHGLAQLDAWCHKSAGAPFASLSPAQQDQVIDALEHNKADGFSWPTGPAFFTTLRTHTIEGMFADPIYGGNRDFAGWRLIGFPGAQFGYTAKDIDSKEAYSRTPVTGIKGAGNVSVRRG